MQVEAVASLINGVGESVLFAALQREEERHPELGEAERLSRVAARLVPATIPGSPQYHRQALSDLLAIVQRKGMPSFFLTLTADEASELRWSVVAEYEKLCDKMQWEQGWTWESMPVEMAHLMYDRVQIFLKEHLLHPTNPIIGNVTDYVVRWESQVCIALCWHSSKIVFTGTQQASAGVPPPHLQQVEAGLLQSRCIAILLS